MDENKQKLTLDRPAAYEIKVPGQLNESWIELIEAMTIRVENKGEVSAVTILNGTFDQAALQGVLRQLYSLGLPIISVECVEAG